MSFPLETAHVLCNSQTGAHLLGVCSLVESYQFESLSTASSLGSDGSQVAAVLSMAAVPHIYALEQ